MTVHAVLFRWDVLQISTHIATHMRMANLPILKTAFSAKPSSSDLVAPSSGPPQKFLLRSITVLLHYIMVYEFF